MESSLVTGLRCAGDRSLASQLVAHPLVKRVAARLDEHAANSPASVRRQLLATALRLTEKMAPQVHEMVDACVQHLGISDPVELFVYSSASFNAAAVKPEDGRLIVLLSSSLLESFAGNELRFVIGHELGHHVFEHHEIPIGPVLERARRPSPELALKLFSWSRYAEISADRAGAACAQDINAAATALYRLASGLRTHVVQVDIDEFAAQADLMSEQTEAGKSRPSQADWFSTHPFSPLRVKALKAYADSSLAKPGGEPLDMLEARVETLMALMEPSYLDAKTEAAERMRRLLFAGAIAVADADGEVTEAEVAVLEKFFGKSSFSERLDLERIKEGLQERIADAVAQVAPPKRVQVLRDLCLVARAGRSPEPAARRVLLGIARDLEISSALVDQTLGCALEPD